MASITFRVPSESVDLRVRHIEGVERLGEPVRFELTLVSSEPVASADVLGQPCSLLLENPAGERVVLGTVTRFASVITAQAEASRVYRVVFESQIAVLRHRRLTRVFQRMTVPDVIQKVLMDAGFPESAFARETLGGYEEREYLVQYAETDLDFIRRLCEEEGLYYRLSPREQGETFVLLDASTAAEAPLEEPLMLVDASDLPPKGLFVFHPSVTCRRRPGKVTLRDYDPQRPALLLEGTSEGGAELEKETEVYLAPGRFKAPEVGQDRARQLLESLRTDAHVVSFKTSAIPLAPGDAFAIEAGPDASVSPRVEGEHVVVAVHHTWSAGDERHGLRIEAIPKAAPFQLARVTPRPRIFGLHSAVVTGPDGSEIHPDKEGRIFVRFFWDREGPADEKSSLPIRVSQPNVPGSMVIPRVGWEVLVAFEDGDPDRPYVLGRVYNAKFPPPVALPANKTMTILRTFSSPGGARNNTISFDDAAGRQHVEINAGFGKSTTVANDMLTQTAKVEEISVKGSQTRSVGANEDVSVTEALIVKVGSQSASVGGMQDVYVKGNVSVEVGSEAVVVGGALLEKVGNPVQGLTNLATSAAIAGAGALGSKLGPVGQAITAQATTAAGIGWGAYSAAAASNAGPNASRDAGIRGIMGVASGFVPGGDALLSSVSGIAGRFPWEPPPEGGGAAEGGGGAGGAQGDGAGAGGPGAGLRNTVVKGAMTEAIGAANAVLTPGSIQWQTSGAALVGVGASHSTKAVRVNVRVLGASIETLGSFHVKTAADAGRQAKGPVSTTVGGSLTYKAGGQYSLKGGSSATLKVGGSLTLNGSAVTFVCGGSVVSASPGGVLVKAGTITITGASKQSGKTTHG